MAFISLERPQTALHAIVVRADTGFGHPRAFALIVDKIATHGNGARDFFTRAIEYATPVCLEPGRRVIGIAIVEDRPAPLAFTVDILAGQGLRIFGFDPFTLSLARHIVTAGRVFRLLGERPGTHAYTVFV